MPAEPSASALRPAPDEPIPVPETAPAPAPAPEIRPRPDAEAGSPAGTLAAERAHLGRARAALRRMRQHAESLSADAAGDRVSRDVLESLLEQRIIALADHPDTPLFFGRLDRAPDTAPQGDPLPDREPEAERQPEPEPEPDTGEQLPTTFYVGRRHVHDDDGRALVLDWRAPVSRAFYQAGPKNPMGLRLRRRFGFDGGELTAFEDEPFDGRDVGPSKILTAEIERPRSGPMRDIVATIQPEQDEIVRSDLRTTICVQGAPGTGKTAVGLHRAAYLLFTHRERLSRSGVLVVGPNRAFLSYISAVLPALGEVRVEQATIADLLGTAAADEAPEVAALKGDPRLAEVLRRALWRQVRKPEEGLMVARGSARYRIPDHEVREIAASLLGTTRYGPGRAAFAQRLAHRVLVQMEQRGEAPDDRVQDSVARSAPVKRLLGEVWPKLTPQEVLFRLFADARLLSSAARGILDDEEQAMLLWPAQLELGRRWAAHRTAGAVRLPSGAVRAPRSHRSVRWTAADRALLDELADLIDRTPAKGHIVVDEAQDLSAMQLRALGRRCSTGSATVLGDIAQGTTPWSVRSWEEVLRHLGQDGEVTELALGFRVPREVLDFAARLLPSIAPELAVPRSLRSSPDALAVRPVADPVSASVRACRDVLRREEGSIGLIVADHAVGSYTAALAADGVGHRLLSLNPGDAAPDAAPDMAPDADGGGGGGEAAADARRLSVVPATLAKGLEFDHVVLAEPAEITAAEERGRARLYVALTRAVTSLTVLHAGDLPAELA